MKPFAFLLIGALSTALASPLRRAVQEPGQEEVKGHPIVRYPLEEQERLTKEVQGSWMLMRFEDPNEEAFDDSALDGFATFHDGFLTLMIQGRALETRFLGRVREHLFVQAGAYRYRFDELFNLQTASVVSFSNTNPGGDLAPDPAGAAGEYQVRLADDELMLRNPTGGVLTFRRVQAGEFPETAIRTLEKRRSGAEAWEERGNR